MEKRGNLRVLVSDIDGVRERKNNGQELLLTYRKYLETIPRPQALEELTDKFQLTNDRAGHRAI